MKHTPQTSRGALAGRRSPQITSLLFLLLWAGFARGQANVYINSTSPQFYKFATYSPTDINQGHANTDTFHIADISSNISSGNLHEYLEIFCYNNKELFLSDKPPQLLIKKRGSQYFNHHDFVEVNNVLTVSGDIYPGNTYEDTYEVWVRLFMPPLRAHCEKVWFEFRTTLVNVNPSNAGQHGHKNYGYCEIYFSRYTDSQDAFNTSDLFIKDNFRDDGQEPFYPYDYERKDVSVNILNTLYNTTPSITYNGINPTLTNANYAQRSTLGNFNYMNVLIENRACVANPQPAQVEMFWSINKITEAWGRDWYNFESNWWAADNYVEYSMAGVSARYPAGNEITIEDKTKYSSPSKPHIIPAGAVKPSITSAYPPYTPSGGYLATVAWNPPDHKWYTKDNSIFRWTNNKIDPIMCFLAVITEPDKPNGGFNIFAPRDYSYIQITGYALPNNNVAMVNSYLATPKSIYKNIGKGNDNIFTSNVGALLVNNPFGLPAVNISLKGDQPTGHHFEDNGSVYLLFGEDLWKKWVGTSNVGAGRGFEVVSDYVLKITDFSLATIEGITLGQGEEDMLGLMFEYDGNHAPEEDYYFGMTLSSFENDPYAEGSSNEDTYFNTLVLHTPALEPAEQAYRTAAVSGVEAAEPEIDFLTAYPNPLSSQLNLSYYLRVDARMMLIELYDMSGRQIRTIEHADVKKGRQNFSFDTNDLPNGNYLVKINIDGRYTTLKLVK